MSRQALEPGEKTVQLGSILVTESLKDWLVEYAKSNGGQGRVVRRALMREKRRAEAAERRFESLLQKARGAGLV